MENENAQSGRRWLEWVRDKILPWMLTGTFVVGVMMYTKLQVISVQLEYVTEESRAQLKDHESRLRDIEKELKK